MSILPKKFIVLIPIALLLGVIAAWQSPWVRLVLLMMLLLFGIVQSLASVIAKHRTARQLGRITSTALVGNVLIEIIFLLSVMALAGILGRYAAQLATQQIDHDFMRFVAGIVTGMLVGIGVGAALHPLWGRLVKTGTEN
jgi:hypothetical protein